MLHERLENIVRLINHRHLRTAHDSPPMIDRTCHPYLPSPKQQPCPWQAPAARSAGPRFLYVNTFS